MSNRRKVRRPWLAIPRRRNVADLAWAAHREKVRKAAEAKAKAARAEAHS